MSTTERDAVDWRVRMCCHGEAMTRQRYPRVPLPAHRLRHIVSLRHSTNQWADTGA
jgi:hypothetical protein